jgi:tetratricopeptide (TPR) repeat protein
VRVVAGAGEVDDPPPGVKPGALTALLREVAAAPEPSGAGDPSLPEGTVLGRYETLHELGRGAFGVVYEARDRSLGRMVALKVVRPGRAEVGETKVIREAEAIARLTHPNLITLHDVGQSDHGPYLVFELLRGRTLEERMDGGPLPVEQAVHVAAEIARGLAHAHGEGVVHRDLKPSNVFVTDGGLVKILDFGMAHAFGRRRLSGGTPAYMAPEQWEDAPEDERTDVFALGVMLHRMLSGEYPFPESGGKWSAGPTPAPVLEIPGAPGLAGMILRMLARTPTQRPRDGAAVLAELAPIEDALRARAASGAPPVKATRRKATLGDLVAEMKRRHVFRVMLGYGVFSFAVLQVSEPVIHGAHLPDWVLSAVLVALAAGFPVAVILAWLYDLTSRGVERTPPAAGPAGTAFSRARLLPPLALAASVLALVAAGAAGWSAWKHAGSRPATGKAARTVVAVADFQNQTGDPELDALSGLLVTSLEQSRQLDVLTRTRMVDLLRQAGEPVPRVIDERMARVAGRRAGTRAVLLPVIQKLGSTYTVELRGVDPEKEVSLFSVSERATSKEAIFELINRLGDQARRGLHEDEKAIGADHVPVGKAFSDNLEAYRHVVLAEQALEDHDFGRSVAEAKAALAVDPTNALAHAWLAFLTVFEVAGAEDPRAHMKAAMAAAGSLPEKERRFVEALDLMVSGDPGATAVFQRLAEDYPQEKLYWWMTARTSIDPATNRDSLLKALALDPSYVWPLYGMMMGGIDPSSWVPLARRAVELRPGFKTTFNLGLALGNTGQFEEALATARQAQALARPPRAEVDSLAAAALVALDRLPEGAAQLEPWLLPGVDDANRHMALVQLIQIEALQGRRRAALRSLAEDQRIRLAPASQGWDWLYAGMAGDVEAARRGLRALKDPDPDLAPFFFEYGLVEEGKALVNGIKGQPMKPIPAAAPMRDAVRALIDWREGRAAAAAPAFEKALDQLGRRNSSWAYLLGRMLADAGRCDAAVVEFDRVARLFPWAWAQKPAWGIRMPLSLLEGARCQVKLGRPDEARARLDRLLLIWKDADDDLPALAEAKQLRASLR